jgi:hypothetical protein
MRILPGSRAIEGEVVDGWKKLLEFRNTLCEGVVRTRALFNRRRDLARASGTLPARFFAPPEERLRSE